MPSVIFRDRAKAGERLAAALAQWRGQRPLVLAIPRGAVPMGAIIAERLGGDLDVVLIRKLGAPGNDEFAIGAVDETGWTYLAPHASSTGATRDYIDRQVARELETMRRRRAQYTPARSPLDPRGRIAIVVDDGLATGATMRAAVQAVRQQSPARVVVAVPVGAKSTCDEFRGVSDEIVCARTPEPFSAVGQWYRDFSQTSDEEVRMLLEQHASGRRAGRIRA